MTKILYKFSLESAKFNAEVLVAVILVWATIVACAVASVGSQSFTERQRKFWIALIVAVPIFGLLAYLPFSVRREDIPAMFLLRRPKAGAKSDKSMAGGGRS